MSDSETVFPLAAASGDATAAGEPLLLDGMEVLFDRTVGLYPVELEPKPAPTPSRGAATNGRSARGNGALH